MSNVQSSSRTLLTHSLDSWGQCFNPKGFRCTRIRRLPLATLRIPIKTPYSGAWNPPSKSLPVPPVTCEGGEAARPYGAECGEAHLENLLRLLIKNHPAAPSTRPSLGSYNLQNCKIKKTHQGKAHNKNSPDRRASPLRFQRARLPTRRSN